MTTEERLEKLERELANAKRRNRWPLAVVGWAGVIFIVLMCFFPPWTDNWTIQGYHFSVIPAGYHCILFPPESSRGHYVTINTTRLILQCVIVALLMGCLFWTVGKWKENSQSRGSETNWARGFKRITLLVAIAAATVSGFCIGAIPITKYCDAQDQPWVADPLVVRKPSEQEVKEFEKWLQEMAAKGTIIEPPYYTVVEQTDSRLELVEPSQQMPSSRPALLTDEQMMQIATRTLPKGFKLDTASQKVLPPRSVGTIPYPSLKEIRPILLKDNTIRFWRNLSKPKLVGICVLAGLAGASAAFASVWVCFWLGGLAVYRVMRWVVLGFCDKEPKS